MGSPGRCHGSEREDGAAPFAFAFGLALTGVALAAVAAGALAAALAGGPLGTGGPDFGVVPTEASPGRLGPAVPTGTRVEADEAREA